MKKLSLKDYCNKNIENDPRFKRDLVFKLVLACKCSRETAYRWISGKARPSELAKEVISKITGISVSDL